MLRHSYFSIFNGFSLTVWFECVYMVFFCLFFVERHSGVVVSTVNW